MPILYKWHCQKLNATEENNYTCSSKAIGFWCTATTGLT